MWRLVRTYALGNNVARAGSCNSSPLAMSSLDAVGNHSSLMHGRLPMKSGFWIKPSTIERESCIYSLIQITECILNKWYCNGQPSKLAKTEEDGMFYSAFDANFAGEGVTKVKIKNILRKIEKSVSFAIDTTYMYRNMKQRY